MPDKPIYAAKNTKIRLTKKNVLNLSLETSQEKKIKTQGNVFNI